MCPFDLSHLPQNDRRIQHHWVLKIVKSRLNYHAHPDKTLSHTSLIGCNVNEATLTIHTKSSALRFRNNSPQTVCFVVCYYSLELSIANSKDPDQKVNREQSNLGLYCLQ